MRNLALEARATIEETNVTPIWLLPFWRLVRGQAQGDFAAAYRMLPDHLPSRVKRPTKEQAAIVLVDHRLHDRRF